MSGGRPRVPASHGVMSIRSSAGASFAMIDLHYAPTPNGWKISILLEELGLPYTVTPVNIRAGEQFRPEFLAISPNNRIPAIVDHAPLDGGGPLSVFETGAILRSEEHTSELQSQSNLVCRLLLEKKKKY